MKMSETILTKEQAMELSSCALAASGATQDNAVITAEALVRAEFDGQKGHGLSRVPSYCAQLRTGKVNGRAQPVLQRVKPGLLRIDASNGFAYPAIRLALPELGKRAKDLGIAAAAIYHSHHFGVAGHPCEDLAREGCIAFIYGNTPKAIAPFGAKEKVLGTNPIAFAAPGEEDPLVIDFAVSAVARGKIMAARQAGQNIPEGWALAPDGEPTTDPDTALQGSMVPIGGAKGAALALMVEVMSGCLAGAALSVEAGSLFEGVGDPPNLGQVLLAIDAQALSADAFGSRFKDLAAVYDRTEGARFPGLKRLQNRKAGAEQGVAVPAALVGEIKYLTH